MTVPRNVKLARRRAAAVVLGFTTDTWLGDLVVSVVYIGVVLALGYLFAGVCIWLGELTMAMGL